MTHEIEIIISHFSRPLKSFSVTFMAHGIYNTPTFHGSWTLVPDISCQIHEPWKPLPTFHRKFMALKNRPWKWNICIQGPEKCFPEFLMTFSWDFHNITVHSVTADSDWAFNDVSYSVRFMVDWLRFEANCQALLGGDDVVLSGKRCNVLSICMSWRLKSR